MKWIDTGRQSSRSRSHYLYFARTISNSKQLPCLYAMVPRCLPGFSLALTFLAWLDDDMHVCAAALSMKNQHPVSADNYMYVCVCIYKHIKCSEVYVNHMPENQCESHEKKKCPRCHEITWPVT
jgi:hypothetical protein